MADAPPAAQWFAAADRTRHPIIEISSDSSDGEVAAGGSCDALAPLDPAAAQAGDASEDDERELKITVAGVRHYKRVVYEVSISMVYFRHTANRERERCTLDVLAFCAFWHVGAAHAVPEPSNMCSFRIIISFIVKLGRMRCVHISIWYRKNACAKPWTVRRWRRAPQLQAGDLSAVSEHYNIDILYM